MNRNEYMKELRKLHPQYDCDLIEQVETRYIASLEGQVKELRRALKAQGKEVKGKELTAQEMKRLLEKQKGDDK